MGLAAGQARLLTITGRKSDCEFESMRLSHQKIALARELADLSNEYQNSLDQTKLVYDYYGTGDTALELSYGILMNPSALNDYKPVLLTDSMNRAVLNSTLAAVARQAGIPREGLGTLPSEIMRNNFIVALADNGVISEYLKTSIIGNVEEGIIGVPYNQEAGFGGDTQITTVSRTLNITDLCDYISGLGDFADVGNACAADTSHIKQYAITQYKSGDSTYDSRNPSGVTIEGFNNAYMNLDSTSSSSALISASMTGTRGGEYSIGDIILDALEGQDYMLTIYGQDNWNNVTGQNGIVDFMCNLNLWDQMFELFENILNDGSAATELALLNARERIRNTFLTNPSAQTNSEQYMWKNMCSCSCTYGDVGTGSASCSASGGKNVDGISLNNVNNASPDGINDFDTCASVTASRGDDEYDSWVMNRLNGKTGYVGMCVVENNDNYGDCDNDSDMSAGCINISRMVMAYLTEVYKELNGTAAGDYKTVLGPYSMNKFIGKEAQFTIYDTEIATDVTSYGGYYDTLFNIICKNGWTENNNIEDNDYLRTMLQNGMVYLSRQKDDRFYYQNNYATDSYIKEVADETLIARAEANYNTEKAKLNAKEETLDLKMKNLDTEISALTTEYDTVKNTITKQIEKSFKRYNA